MPDNKIKYTLGNLQIVKADNSYGSAIITAWKNLSGFEGETFTGYVIK